MMLNNNQQQDNNPNRINLPVQRPFVQPNYYSDTFRVYVPPTPKPPYYMLDEVDIKPDLFDRTVLGYVTRQELDVLENPYRPTGAREAIFARLYARAGKVAPILFNSRNLERFQAGVPLETFEAEERRMADRRQKLRDARNKVPPLPPSSISDYKPVPYPPEKREVHPFLQPAPVDQPKLSEVNVPGPTFLTETVDETLARYTKDMPEKEVENPVDEALFITKEEHFLDPSEPVATLYWLDPRKDLTDVVALRSKGQAPLTIFQAKKEMSEGQSLALVDNSGSIIGTLQYEQAIRLLKGQSKQVLKKPNFALKLHSVPDAVAKRIANFLPYELNQGLRLLPSEKVTRQGLISVYQDLELAYVGKPKLYNFARAFQLWKITRPEDLPEAINALKAAVINDDFTVTWREGSKTRIRTFYDYLRMTRWDLAFKDSTYDIPEIVEVSGPVPEAISGNGFASAFYLACYKHGILISILDEAGGTFLAPKYARFFNLILAFIPDSFDTIERFL